MSAEQLRGVAAGAMLVSGVTHVRQLGVYGVEAIAPALAGVVYFAIGVGLRGRGRAALWAGAILPTLGGVGGVIRFVFLHANPFSVLHVLIDCVVVPICVTLLRRERAAETGLRQRARSSS